MASNIFTKQIAEYLEVPLDKAEEIQNIIDQYFYLDWSEADDFEMRAAFLAANEFYKMQLKL
jgi:cell division ATPase FtsA